MYRCARCRRNSEGNMCRWCDLAPQAKEDYYQTQREMLTLQPYPDALMNKIMRENMIMRKALDKIAGNWYKRIQQKDVAVVSTEVLKFEELAKKALHEAYME